MLLVRILALSGSSSAACHGVMIYRVENNALFRSLEQKQNRFGNLVNRQKLNQVVHLRERTATDYREDFQPAHGRIGAGVDLKFAVDIPCGQRADAHNLCVESVVGNGVQNRALRQKFRANVLSPGAISDSGTL